MTSISLQQTDPLGEHIDLQTPADALQGSCIDRKGGGIKRSGTSELRGELHKDPLYRAIGRNAGQIKLNGENCTVAHAGKNNLNSWYALITSELVIRSQWKKKESSRTE